MEYIFLKLIRLENCLKISHTYHVSYRLNVNNINLTKMNVRTCSSIFSDNITHFFITITVLGLSQSQLTKRNLWFFLSLNLWNFVMLSTINTFQQESNWHGMMDITHQEEQWSSLMTV